MNTSLHSSTIQSQKTAVTSEIEESKTGQVFDHRIPSLDGLRALSIAFVLFCHFGTGSYFDESTVWGASLISLGVFGVKIFFVISGYLITLLLLQEQKKTGRIDLFHFYVRRSFRILPAAYFYMAVCFVIFAHKISLTNKVLALFFLENYSPHTQWTIGHLWSLGVEEQFYMIWPALFLFVPRYRTPILIGVLCVVPFINVAIIHFHLPYWGMAFYSVADSLACGCLLAIIRNGRQVNAILNSRFFALIPLSLLLAIPIAVTPGGLVFGLVKSLMIRPWLNIGIALSLEKSVRGIPVLLNASWITRIGVMSYSIYLWQQPVTASRLFHLSAPLEVGARLFLIAVLASFSYYMIELPFLRLRKRLFS